MPVTQQLFNRYWGSTVSDIAKGGILLFRMLARTNETQDVII